jgi:hypothetical protein
MSLKSKENSSKIATKDRIVAELDFKQNLQVTPGPSPARAVSPASGVPSWTNVTSTGPGRRLLSVEVYRTRHKDVHGLGSHQRRAQSVR